MAVHHRPTYRLDSAWAIGDFGLSKATFLIEGDSRRGVLDGTGSGKLRVSMAQVAMVSDFSMAWWQWR